MQIEETEPKQVAIADAGYMGSCRYPWHKPPASCPGEQCLPAQQGVSCPL
jgi:hypothetical protein